MSNADWILTPTRPIPSHPISFQDYPDGQYDELKAKGQKEEDSAWQVVRAAATNYRTWILVVSYGYCFGVELTVDNIIAQYFFDRFSVPLMTAGFIAGNEPVTEKVSTVCCVQVLGWDGMGWDGMGWDGIGDLSRASVC